MITSFGFSCATMFLFSQNKLSSSFLDTTPSRVSAFSSVQHGYVIFHTAAAAALTGFSSRPPSVRSSTAASLSSSTTGKKNPHQEGARVVMTVVIANLLSQFFLFSVLISLRVRRACSTYHIRELRYKYDPNGFFVLFTP